MVSSCAGESSDQILHQRKVLLHWKGCQALKQAGWGSSENMSMWCLMTWFTGGPDGVELMVGLGTFGVFQP